MAENNYVDNELKVKGNELSCGDISDIDYVQKITDLQEEKLNELNNKVQDLTTSLEEKKSTNNVPKEYIEEVKFNIEYLRNEITILKQYLAKVMSTEKSIQTCDVDIQEKEEMLAELTLLRKKNEELENSCSLNKITELEQQIKTLQEDKDNLLMKIEIDTNNNNSNEIISKLKTENSNLQSEIESLLKTNEEEGLNQFKIYQNKVTALESEKLNLELRLYNLNHKIHDILERFERNITANAKQKEEAEQEIETLKISNDELKNTNEKLKSKLSAQNDHVQNVTNNEIIQLKKEKADLEAEKSLLEGKLDDSYKHQNEIVNKFNTNSFKEIEYDKEIIKLKTKLRKCKLFNKNLDNQVKELENKFSNTENEEKERYTDLEKQIDNLTVQKNTIEEERDTLQRENKAFLLRIGELQSKIGRLHCDSCKLECAKEEAKYIKEEFESTKQQYQNEVSKLKLEKETMFNENENLKNQLVDLQNTLIANENIELLLADRQKDRETLIQDIEKLQIQLEETETKYETQIKKINEELNILKLKIIKLEIEKNEEISNLQQEYENNLNLAKEQYNKDIQFLRGRHVEGITKLQNMHDEAMQDKIKDCESKIEDIKTQKNAYRDALREKRDEIEDLKVELINQKRKYTEDLDEMKKNIELEKIRTEEKVSKLAQKCWDELERIKGFERHKKMVKLIYERKMSDNSGI